MISTNKGQNYTNNNDASYDAMYQKAVTAATIPEAQEAVKAADLYALSQHWQISIFPLVSNVLWQPWLEGYNSQSTGAQDPLFARMWIDPSMK